MAHTGHLVAVFATDSQQKGTRMKTNEGADGTMLCASDGLFVCVRVHAWVCVCVDLGITGIL